MGRLIPVRIVLVLTFVMLLTVGGAAVAVPPTAASVSMGVTPSLVELTATPGDHGSQDITVSNEGDEPFDATTGTAPLHGASDEASAAPWLTVQPATFHLEPQQTQVVTVTIAVPDDLASGGYYGLVTITTGATKSDGNGAGVAGQIGVPFLVAVDGTRSLSRKAEVERFAPVLEADGRIGFRALVRSSGNLYVVAKGTVEVAQDGGKPLASLDFPETTPILQGNQQLLQTQGSLPLEDGTKYDAAATIDYGAKKPVTAKAAFTVTAPALAIADLGVCENLDKGPTLQFGLRNEADLGVLPAVTLAVRDANGAELGSGPLPEQPLVWPKDRTGFAVDFPQRLVTGAYVFAVTVQLPNGQPVTQERPFQIGGTGADVAPLCGQLDEATPVATPTA